MLHAALDRLPKQPRRLGYRRISLRHFEQMVMAMQLSVDRAEPGAITRVTDGKLKTVVDIDAGERAKSVLTEIELTPNTPFNPDYALTLDRKWQRTGDKLDEAGKKIKVIRDGKATTRNQKETITYESENDIPVEDRWGQARIDLVSSLLPVRDLLKRQLQLEAEDAPASQIEANRGKLNAAYDSFVSEYARCTRKRSRRSRGRCRTAH